MLRCKAILFIVATIALLPLAAQVSNLRTQKIAAYGTVHLDTVSIVPETMQILHYDTSYFSIDYVNAILVWKRSVAQDSVIITYRVFSQKLNKEAQLFSFDSIRNNFIAQSEILKKNTTPEPLFNFGNLNYSGSFGRSISFGNNQDGVFNSQFNVQLNGLIGDSIQIAAAITDNNIPIQPDGTTQQLNEFDRVLLQFKKKDWEINLGDIDLRQNESYFLNFYKRLQGLLYTQQFKFNNTTNQLLLSGAIAKGKFARNVVAVQEGNQGPYRLYGNNNEFYLIVLAGTERVFIDGQLMQRGEDADYVMNYNTAEITFMPRQMITKDKRVQVEFEYADRNYLNSMLYLNNTTNFGNRFSLSISAYSNTDAKNSPINQTLNSAQKQFLANIGDSVQNAFYPVAEKDSFSTSKILYKKIDTVYNGIHDSIFVYSTNPDSAKYNLSFVETGFGRGNYIPLFNAANGKVFQWVAPINGKPQGSFEPAAFLVAPKLQQIVSMGIRYTLNKNNILYAELSASKNDINTFSQKDKGNDGGYAAKINWQYVSEGKKYTIHTNTGYEFVNENFQTVERLRAPEFFRDWGLPLITNKATEHLPSFQIKLNDKNNNALQYNFSSYIRNDGYKGYRNTLEHLHTIKGWQLNDNWSLTSFQLPNDKGIYFKPSITLQKTFASFHNYNFSAGYAMEYQKISNNLTDTIAPSSFAFETISASIKSDERKANKWSFTYFTRTNKLPSQKQLLQTDRSHNYNLQAEWMQNKHHQFKLNVTYRQLFITNNTLTNQKPDNTLMGRAEYLINTWKGFLTGNVWYELGSGQEQRRDFSYVEVPAGRGEYAWNDYNNDGIPQLNEFELAMFADQAKYIRLYTPTLDFVKANYNQFNYSVSLNPNVFFNASVQQPIWKKIMRKLSLLSSLQTYKKEIAQGNPSFNPFKGSITDTSLININYILSHTLSINKTGNWGADISNLSNYNKALLTYGFEIRQLNNWLIKGRINIAKAYTIELTQQLGTNKLLTPAFDNRNYSLDIISTQPSVSYTAGTLFRVTMGYEYLHKTNKQIYGGETATSNSLNIESKYNTPHNASLLAAFKFSNIQFNGENNTTVSYIMLDGLLAGKNFLWNMSFTKRLINNLEINIEYEGRKPGTTRTIHTGRIGLRALL